MVCPQNPSLTKSRTGATLNISANDISDGVQKGVCAINNTGKVILKDHLEHCIVDANDIAFILTNSVEKSKC